MSRIVSIVKGGGNLRGERILKTLKSSKQNGNKRLLFEIIEFINFRIKQSREINPSKNLYFQEIFFFVKLSKFF